MDTLDWDEAEVKAPRWKGALDVFEIVIGAALVVWMLAILVTGQPVGKETIISSEDTIGVTTARRAEDMVPPKDLQGETVAESGLKKIEERRWAEQLKNQGRKLVALTFDDGPSYATTPRLLDILKEKGAKATFFVVGTMAERAPELLKREEAEGHEVGSHTVGHGNLAKMGVGEIVADMGRMNEIFRNALGREVEILRPPYGSYTDATKSSVGVPMVFWTVDTLDWKYRDPARVRSEAVGSAFDGAIILMHDIHATTIDAVAGIVDDLRRQGYEFVTVSELAAARGTTMQKGAVYGGFRP